MQTVVTLSATGWFQDEQIVTVLGVTRKSDILVQPDAISTKDWEKWGIEAVAHGANTVTFTCKTTPTYDVYALVTMEA